MKLYTHNGQWIGTKHEARKEFGVVNAVEVPTSKHELIAFLNGVSTDAPEVSDAQLNNEAFSWINWALATLRRGDKAGAEEMLVTGLQRQIDIRKENKVTRRQN